MRELSNEACRAGNGGEKLYIIPYSAITILSCVCRDNRDNKFVAPPICRVKSPAGGDLLSSASAPRLKSIVCPRPYYAYVGSALMDNYGFEGQAVYLGSPLQSEASMGQESRGPPLAYGGS